MADFEYSANEDDVIQNLLRLHSFARGSQQQRDFHFDRIYNAEHQVYYQTSEGSIFAPVKWCGAKANSISKYEIRKRKISQVYQRTLKNIGFRPIVEGQPSYDAVYKEFIDFCHGFEFKNSAAGLPHSDSRPRQFWTLSHIAGPILHNFPDDIENSQDYFEGATKTVAVNAYERNQKARLACIAHYGWACQVCRVDFVAKYGDIGKEFIHVHHVRPLHEIGETYRVDPVNDLRPVCPNCHAMIHRTKPALSIEQLARLMTNVDGLISS